MDWKKLASAWHFVPMVVTVFATGTLGNIAFLVLLAHWVWNSVYTSIILGKLRAGEPVPSKFAATEKLYREHAELSDRFWRPVLGFCILAPLSGILILKFGPTWLALTSLLIGLLSVLWRFAKKEIAAD